MLRISRRYSHFVFGIIQAGLTSAIASGIANFPFSSETFLRRWLVSWLLAWIAMLPIVIFAAPLIRRLVVALTVDEESPRNTHS
jgi:hypothetical protein